MVGKGSHGRFLMGIQRPRILLRLVYIEHDLFCNSSIYRIEHLSGAFVLSDSKLVSHQKFVRRIDLHGRCVLIRA